MQPPAQPWLAAATLAHPRCAAAGGWKGLTPHEHSSSAARAGCPGAWRQLHGPGGARLTAQLIGMHHKHVTLIVASWLPKAAGQPLQAPRQCHEKAAVIVVKAKRRLYSMEACCTVRRSWGRFCFFCFCTCKGV